MSSTKQLALLIRRKLDVIEQLHRIAGQQQTIAETGEMNRLFEILSAKQTLITQLNTIEAELHPFRSEDPEARKWESAERRRECALWAKQCEKRLAEILLLEQECQQQMVNRRDEAAARMAETTIAVDVAHAYTQSSKRAGKGIDLVCD